MAKKSTVLFVLSALLLGLLIGQTSIASAHGGDGTLIHACVNKSTGFLKIVKADTVCPQGWQNLDWGILGPTGPKGDQGDPGPAGAGVKTISGIVNADGSPNPVTTKGFTSERLGLGEYRISFPPGTWQSFPVMTVTPFGINGAFGNPVVLSALGFGDGSAQFVIRMSSTTPGQTLFDNAFMFIATESLP